MCGGVGRVVTCVIKNTLDPVDNFGRVVACRPQPHVITITRLERLKMWNYWKVI